MAIDTIQMALFKAGVEVPNTRFEVVDPNVGLVTANPLETYTSFFQLKGQATISNVLSTDDIELRVVAGGPAILQGVNNTVVVASMNIEKVSV